MGSTCSGLEDCLPFQPGSRYQFLHQNHSLKQLAGGFRVWLQAILVVPTWLVGQDASHIQIAVPLIDKGLVGYLEVARTGINFGLRLKFPTLKSRQHGKGLHR